ncbi:MAG: hypothetical protein HYX96_06140 [Chloroflexi bacterium]|nr:hypothetical protein [Chloroflexota bacterium]
MADQAQSQNTIVQLRDLLVDFGLPALVLVITGLLILSGRDSELKTVFVMAAGWLFKSGYTRTKK